MTSKRYEHVVSLVTAAKEVGRTWRSRMEEAEEKQKKLEEEKAAMRSKLVELQEAKAEAEKGLKMTGHRAQMESTDLQESLAGLKGEIQAKIDKERRQKAELDRVIEESTKRERELVARSNELEAEVKRMRTKKTMDRDDVFAALREETDMSKAEVLARSISVAPGQKEMVNFNLTVPEEMSIKDLKGLIEERHPEAFMEGSKPQIFGPQIFDGVDAEGQRVSSATFRVMAELDVSKKVKRDEVLM